MVQAHQQPSVKMLHLPEVAVMGRDAYSGDFYELHNPGITGPNVQHLYTSLSITSSRPVNNIKIKLLNQKGPPL